MPGPQPMHPSARQRQNKTSTRAELEILGPEDRALISVPELPADRLWDPKTSEWWVDVHQSPMRLEWDASDLHKITMLAYLVDEFFIETQKRTEGKTPSAYVLSNLVATITATGKTLGLDPFARRSLQWQFVQLETAEMERDEKKADAAKRNKPAADKKRRRKGGEGLK